MDLRELPIPGECGGSRHFWELARYTLVSEMYRRLRRRVGDEEIRVLDVGCGDAYVVIGLADAFPADRFEGIDTAFDAETMARIRANRLGGRLELRRSVYDVPTDAEPARIVLLLDVVEHLTDDVREVRSILASPTVAPDAYVLVTVPAYQGLFASHDHILGHRRRYSRTHLVRTMRRAGLKVLKTGSFFTSLLPLRLAQMAAERSGVRTPPAQSALTRYRGGAGYSRAVARMLLWDWRVGEAARRVGVQLPGLSCYAICRRRRGGVPGGSEE